jgi:hypothetical protein
MQSLIYIRLIGHTAGTLLLLFWMVAIVGYRRQRNFERVFFFLCVALFLFYSGSLLALNSHIYYPQPPAALNEFAIGIITLGLCMLPAVLLHLHVEYAETRGLLRSKRWKLAVLLAFYALCLHLAVQRIPLLYQDPRFDFVLPGRSLGDGFAIVLAAALAWSAIWEGRFALDVAGLLCGVVSCGRWAAPCADSLGNADGRGGGHGIRVAADFAFHHTDLPSTAA